MPEAFRKSFTQTVLAEEPEVNYTGMKPYGIDRVIAENTSPVGVKLRELGLFTFISSSLDKTYALIWKMTSIRFISFHASC